jgi:hypothetical protein
LDDEGTVAVAATFAIRYPWETNPPFDASKSMTTTCPGRRSMVVSLLNVNSPPGYGDRSSTRRLSRIPTAARRR